MNWDGLTIGEVLSQTARTFRDKTALVGLEPDGTQQRLSFAELDRAVDETALGLQSLGVVRGDQVALWLVNSPDWVICWLACTRLGAVLVPLNTRFKSDEVEYILRQSDARVLIGMDAYWGIDFAGMIAELIPELAHAEPGKQVSSRLPELRAVVLWRDTKLPGGTTLQALRAIGRQRLDNGERLAPARAQDPVIIVYTSGTTGHPKGAMHSHVVMRNAANIIRVMHMASDDVILGHMPFYHVAGAFTEVIPMVMLGATLVTLAQWIPDEALDIIGRERVSIFGGIPTHFIDCLDAIRRRPRDVSSLKSAWIGGAPVTPDVAMAAREELGLRSLQAVYGMTETTAATVFSEFEGPDDVLCENKGRPIGEFEVAVCDPLSGRSLPTGEVGEVRVRGHLVMMGYYKNPAATAEAITPEGWFRTGDLGVFDAAGFLKITGRLKEMFIVGGSNAYPAEIERLLQGIEQVKQAVVIGVPDRRLGEVGFAFVQLHPEADPSQVRLAERCRALMADYKVPRHWRIVEDFPRTSTGKIQRFLLSQQAREAVTSPSAKSTDTR